VQVRWVATLYDYSRWANGQVLETAAALTHKQLLAAGGVGYGSVRDILAHTLATQWLWLSRWQGNSPRSMWPAGDFPDLATLGRRWEEVERATATFLNDLTSERLAGDLTYAATSGAARTQPLWQLMLHQANHATQHRSEAAYLLTQAGHSPGDLDLLAYLLQRSG
jgi:uncharacterized damage-inducible protein DinB